MLAGASTSTSPSSTPASRADSILRGASPRMWMAREVRGLGLGRRILVELERYARERGVGVVHLETNGTLNEAIALYRASGYREVPAFNDEPYAHHWFEKALT